MPTVSIIRNGNELDFEIGSSRSLHEELEEKGEDLPHGCLSGSCGVCTVEVLEGAENLDSPSQIEQDTIDCIKETYCRDNGENALDNRSIRMACRCKLLNGKVKITPLKG